MYYSILVSARYPISLNELKDRFGDECTFSIKGNCPGVCRIIVKDIKVNPYAGYGLDLRDESSLLTEIRAKIEMTGADVISTQRMEGIP